MNLLHSTFLDTDKRLVFVFICLLSSLLTYLAQSFFVTEELFYYSLGEQVAIERFEKLWAESQKWQWVTYLILPVLYLVKFVLVSFCIITGALLANVKIGFKRVFQVVLVAEAIFFLPILLRLGWFAFVQTDYTLADLQYFMPLSLANLFDVSKLEIWWVYPFQVANLFEVAYWLLLAYGLHLHTQKEYDSMLRLVLSSYGSGLLLWVVLVMFLNVNFS
jgi:hypothetical protein